jgi:hypothetical protein
MDIATSESGELMRRDLGTAIARLVAQVYQNRNGATSTPAEWHLG